MFDQMPLILVSVGGEQMVIEATNDRARKVFGDRMTPGVPVFDSFVEVAPQGFEEAMRQVLATGQTVVVEGWRADIVIADGSRVTLFLDCTYHPRVDADGRVTGVLCMTEDVTDRVLARHAMEAQVAAVTEDYERTRQAVTSLQRSLLPDRVPVLPTLDVAATYVLAADDQAAGGDWFDVVVRDGGRVVLVVGDVVGHGVEASVAMGRARAVLLDHLEAGISISDAVALLDRRATRHRESFASTVALVDLDPRTGDFDYVTAGHPPPLVVDLAEEESCAVSFVELTGGGPLGTGALSTPLHGVLDAEHVMLLYTDGAIERPGRTAAQGTVQLGRIVHRAGNDLLYPVEGTAAVVDRTTAHVMDQLARLSGHADDVTLVAVRRHAPLPAFTWTGGIDANTVGDARIALHDWLVGSLAGNTDVFAVAHIVTELLQNVVDHAYASPSCGEVRVSAEIGDDGVLTLRVGDDGVWGGPQLHPSRGRGLALVRSVADRTTVETRSDGTTVTVELRLHRPARLRVQPMTPGLVEHPGTFDVFTRSGADHSTVHLRGPVDQRAVGELSAQLVLALTDATDRVDVDLTEVSILSSAGVSVLLATSQRAAECGVEVALLAPVGGAAHQTLSLVGLATERASTG